MKGRFVIRFPKRSTWITSAVIEPSSRRRGSAPSSTWNAPAPVLASPKAAGGSPSTRRATSGAKRSRPSKVVLGPRTGALGPTLRTITSGSVRIRGASSPLSGARKTAAGSTEQRSLGADCRDRRSRGARCRRNVAQERSSRKAAVATSPESLACGGIDDRAQARRVAPEDSLDDPDCASSP
jgi:hypothetical protein